MTGMLRVRWDLLLVVLIPICLASCSKKVEVPYFNYLDCRVKVRAAHEAQGTNPVAADMKAKGYCSEHFKP